MSQRPAPHLEFAPPAPEGRQGALVIAIVAHAVLFLALALATQWRTKPHIVQAEAELWSAPPQAAAPRLQEPPPETQPEPKPEPKAKPTPPPTPDPEIERRDAQIALEKKKQLDKKKEAEKLEQEKAAKEKADKEKKAQEDKALEKKKAAEKAAADNKKRKQDDAKKAADAKADAARMDAMRNENLKRMQGLAGASGGENATGSALKSSGPSSSYGGKIIKLILDYTKNPESSSGGLTVEVFVRTSTSGEIVSSKIIKSSGKPLFDAAVLRGIQKMERVPRDIDGKIPDILVREGLLLTVSL